VITTRQYEAVGRLALAFNDLDFAMRRSLAKILSVPELSVGLLLTDGENFGRNAALFGKVLKALSDEYNSVKGLAEVFSGTITAATTLASERHRYVHATVVVDISNSSIALFAKGADLPFDVDRIEKLALECSALSAKIYSHQDELSEGLKAARAAATRGARI
jgi:hypothetical protein